MSKFLMNAILVGFGGSVGCMARYGISLLSERYTISIPLGTIAANIIGCLCIGAITQLSAATEILSPGVRLLLVSGFCGGITTMSSMIYETAQFLKPQEYMHAVFYIVTTVIGSFIAFYGGSTAVRLLIKSGGGIWN
ncbi:fluoride efflux transporter CrcB [Candidatus Desantisbacteria bacterium]|nr:fluoride efflux transporter CrcB [Candidatus Desantisbacteria bacterium]